MAVGESNQAVDSKQSSSAGVLRDVNASLGALDALNNFGAATSSATSGAVTTGDRIIGGVKGRQIGIVKILALFAAAAVLLKIYKESK